MKLNREQIIKALECCSTFKATDCDECPYRNKNGIVDNFYIGCRNKLCEDVLSLIKELTEENERLGQCVIEYETPAGKQIMPDLLRLDGTVAELYNKIEYRIKIDTVREMQERLHKEATVKMLGTEMLLPIAHSLVDRIAKKMLESGREVTKNT